MKISEADKKKIEEEVAKAEKKTSGEIVPVCLTKSDFYPVAHFRSAILFSFIFAVVLYYLPLEIEDPIWLLLIQIPGIIIGYLICYSSIIKRIFLTKREVSEEVHQRAVEAFLDNNLHTTRDRTGILIMVSLLERRVQILADSGINQKVSQDVWDQIVAKFIDKIVDGKLTEGFLSTIKKCGDILATHFPIKGDDTNELSNNLITD